MNRPVEQRPLTVKDFTRAKSPFSFLGTTEMIRQHGNINIVGKTVDGDEAPLGYHLALEKFRLDQLSNLTKAQKELYWISNIWLDPFKMPDSPILDLPADFNFYDVDGLIELGKTVYQVAEWWIGQDATGRRGELADLVMEKNRTRQSNFFKAAESKVKIEELIATGCIPEDSDFYPTLSSYHQFLGLVFSGLSEQDKLRFRSAENETREYLYRPRDNKDSYMDRALALAGNGGGKKLAAVVETQIKGLLPYELPFIVHEEVLRYAGIMNHVRFMQRLETYGIDLVRTRAEVGQLLRDFPRESRGPYDLSAEQEKWFEEFSRIVSPISNLVYLIDYGSPYFLGQVLEHDQASCAGKTYELTSVLKTLGFDAVVSANKFETSRHESGQHVLSSIRLPGGIMIQLDALFSSRVRDNPLFRKFMHNVAVWLPTGEFTDDFEAVFDEVVKSKIAAFRLSEKGYQLYRIIGRGNYVIEHAENDPEIEYLNFADDILHADRSGYFTDIFYEDVVMCCERELKNFSQDIETAASYMEYVVRYSDQFEAVGGKNLVIQLIRRMRSVADIGFRNNLFHGGFNYWFGRLLIHPLYPDTEEEAVRVRLLLAEENFQRAYENIVPELDVDEIRHSWINLLSDHPEIFAEKYGSVGAVSSKINYLRYLDGPQEANAGY